MIMFTPNCVIHVHPIFHMRELINYNNRYFEYSLMYSFFTKYIRYIFLLVKLAGLNFLCHLLNFHAN